MARELADA
jgi:hypothetical protein